MSSFGSACLPEVEVCRGHFLKLLVGRGGGGGGGGGALELDLHLGLGGGQQHGGGGGLARVVQLDRGAGAAVDTGV